MHITLSTLCTFCSFTSLRPVLSSFSFATEDAQVCFTFSSALYKWAWTPACPAHGCSWETDLHSTLFCSKFLGMCLGCFPPIASTWGPDMHNTVRSKDRFSHWRNSYFAPVPSSPAKISVGGSGIVWSCRSIWRDSGLLIIFLISFPTWANVHFPTCTHFIFLPFMLLSHYDDPACIVTESYFLSWTVRS